MDKTFEPLDLFAKLSPRVAEALAAHFVARGAKGVDRLVGKVALVSAWHGLSAEQREAFRSVLARMRDLSDRKARHCVLEHARESRLSACPSAGRVLDAISTPDLTVRLYLDDPQAFERAHFQWATALLEEVALYQGQYVADVIPSHDRRARMKKALEACAKVRDRPLEVADFVHDDSFGIALHRGGKVSSTRGFDRAGTLDPNLCRPEVEAACLFRFDSSLLIIKAQHHAAREALRDAFVHIFVGDPHYFDARGPQRTRYRLTIDLAPAPALARPSVAKASSRPRIVLSRDTEQALSR